MRINARLKSALPPTLRGGVFPHVFGGILGGSGSRRGYAATAPHGGGGGAVAGYPLLLDDSSQGGRAGKRVRAAGVCMCVCV